MAGRSRMACINRSTSVKGLRKIASRPSQIGRLFTYTRYVQYTYITVSACTILQPFSNTFRPLPPIVLHIVAALGSLRLTEFNLVLQGTRMFRNRAALGWSHLKISTTAFLLPEPTLSACSRSRRTLSILILSSILDFCVCEIDVFISPSVVVQAAGIVSFSAQTGSSVGHCLFD